MDLGLSPSAGVFNTVRKNYCSELDFVIQVAKRNGYLLPTDYQLRCFNAYINEAISNNIFRKGDLLYFFGWKNLLSQNIDTISNANAPSIIGNELKIGNINIVDPTRFLGSFVTNTGVIAFTSNGLFKALNANNNTDNYFSTGYDPSTNATNFTLNNASVTAFINFGEDRLDAINGSTTSSGITDFAINPGLRFNPWSGTNTRQGVLNNTTTENYGASVTTQVGYHHFERTASNALAWYINGVSVQTRTGASTAIQSGEVRFLKRFSNSLEFFRLGASLGSTLQKIDYELYTNLRTKLLYA